MASASGLKLLLLIALVATSCMAQAPSGAPMLSPTAAPVAPPTPTPSPSSNAPTPSPTGGEPTPAPALGTAAPAPAPAADQPPADGSNTGIVSRAAIGGTALTAALIALTLM